MSRLPEGLEECRAAVRMREEGYSPAEILAASSYYDEFHKALPGLAAGILRLLILRFAGKPCDWSIFRKAALEAGYSGAELAITAVMLRRGGFLYKLVSPVTSPVYVIPEELVLWWHGVFCPPNLESETADGENEIEVLPGPSRGAAHAFFLLLAYLRLNKVSYTQTDTLSKRHRKSMGEILRGYKSGGGWQNDHFLQEELVFLKVEDQEDLEKQVERQIQLAQRLGLAVKTGGGLLQLNEERVEAWLKLPVQAMNTILYHGWISFGYPEEPSLFHGAVHLEKYGDGLWHSLPNWMSNMEKYSIIDGNQGEMELRFLSGWLAPLFRCGYMDLGYNGLENRLYFRWKTDLLGKGSDRAVSSYPEGEDQGWYIQPDFEVLVPPGVSYYHLWRLHALAEKVRADEVCVYRLSRVRWIEAIKEGLDAERGLKFLAEHSLYGVPDNVETALREWGKNIVYGSPGSPGQDSSQESRNASFPDESDPGFCAGDSRNFPAGAQDEQISNDCMRDDIDRWLRLASEGAEVEEVWGGTVDGRVAGVDELFPGWRDIPAAWTQSFRSYHASTRKEIVRRAVEWQTFLTMRTLSGERRVLPSRLVEDSRSWTLEAEGPEGILTMAPEEWEEMQIVFPAAGYSWYDKRS